MILILCFVFSTFITITNATDLDGGQEQFGNEGGGGGSADEIGIGGANDSNKGFRIGLIWAKSGQYVDRSRYKTYDFIYGSARDFDYWDGARKDSTHIGPDPVTGALNAQWRFLGGLEIPAPSTIGMEYKDIVENWFPGLGVWTGSNQVFTSWMEQESPKKGTSNCVYYILDGLYQIKKSDDIWKKWCDGEVQVLIEPTMWLTFNEPGPSYHFDENGRQLVVYGTAKDIAREAEKENLGGTGGGGWLQYYINNALPRSLTLNRQEQYYWHTPPKPEGEDYIDV